jgi:hypothetical protein
MDADRGQKEYVHPRSHVRVVGLWWHVVDNDDDVVRIDLRAKAATGESRTRSDDGAARSRKGVRFLPGAKPKSRRVHTGRRPVCAASVVHLVERSRPVRLPCLLRTRRVALKQPRLRDIQQRLEFVIGQRQVRVVQIRRRYR